MREPTLSEQLAVAAGLLLRPPQRETIAVLVKSGGRDVPLDVARQDYYDVLCMPRSGRYVPPYAHVLRHGRTEGDDLWHFPPPRFDGGDALLPWYEAVGFDPADLDVDPMLKGACRPLDHVGLILAYLSGMVASCDAGQIDSANGHAVVVAFLSDYFGEWVHLFCDLLAGSGGVFVEAVGEAVREAVLAVEARFGLPSERADGEYVRSARY